MMERHTAFPGCLCMSGQSFSGLCIQSYDLESDGYGMER